MQSIVNVDPSKVFAYNAQMLSCSRMNISEYFKIVDSKFYSLEEQASSSKDYSDLGSIQKLIKHTKPTI